MIQLRESWTTCQTIKVLVACHTLKVQVVRRKIERNRSFSFFWYSRKIIWGAVVIDATLQTRFGYYLQPSLMTWFLRHFVPNRVLQSSLPQPNFAEFAINFEAAPNYF